MTEETTSGFCPQCGAAAAGNDRFCRNCGAALAEDETDAAPSSKDDGGGAQEGEAPAATRRRGPVIAGAALLAAICAAAAVLATGGAFSSDDAPPDPRAELRAQLAGAISREMTWRDGFFASERRYRLAMRDVNKSLGRYRNALKDYKATSKRIQEEFADEFDMCYRTSIPCPDPDYPDEPKAPSLAEEAKELRAVATDLEQLSTKVLGVSVPARLRLLHAQLLASIDGLKDAAAHNADVLSEAITEPEGDSGTGHVDNGKLETMRPGGKLPAVRAMNRAVIDLLRATGIPVSRYDVPGGRDLDPDDASTEL